MQRESGGGHDGTAAHGPGGESVVVTGPAPGSRNLVPKWAEDDENGAAFGSSQPDEDGNSDLMFQLIVFMLLKENVFLESLG